MIRNTSRRAALVVASALIIACGSSSSREGFNDEADPTDPTGATGNKGSLGTPIADPPPKTDECQKMDILVVVDDSGSMEEEQDNLAVNFPKFISKIDSFTTKSGAKLDWRVAITTTGRDVSYSVVGPVTMPINEKGENGEFRMEKECGTSRRWIEKSDPNASNAFQCLAKVGTQGSGLEMPLYATKLALVDRVADGTNKGFRRDDALLAVIILTDEDDCSREDNNFQMKIGETCATMPNIRPVTEYKQVLDTVAKGEGRWATAVIAGEKDCKSSFGDAAEAKRLKDFVSLAGKAGTFSSICEGDLTGALEKALDTFDAACKALPPADVK